MVLVSVDHALDSRGSEQQKEEGEWVQEETTMPIIDDSNRETETVVGDQECELEYINHNSNFIIFFWVLNFHHSGMKSGLLTLWKLFDTDFLNAVNR